ncbi:MAG: hypothetical protein LBJ00_07535 [Planctomycetaceae bacterium]|nr:hypothetical protein [Planctomycetaceae bacterium]
MIKEENFNDYSDYTEATLKFMELNTQAQQREAVVQGRSLLPYRLRYIGGRFRRVLYSGELISVTK